MKLVSDDIFMLSARHCSKRPLGSRSRKSPRLNNPCGRRIESRGKTVTGTIVVSNRRNREYTYRSRVYYVRINGCETHGVCTCNEYVCSGSCGRLMNDGSYTVTMVMMGTGRETIGTGETEKTKLKITVCLKFLKKKTRSTCSF